MNNSQKCLRRGLENGETYWCIDGAIGSSDTRGLRLPEYQMDVVPEHTLMLSTEYLSTSDDVDLMEPNQSAGEIMILC
ncbi:hypothetical protein ILYODFUR_032757 [Ilyodon furcidens]|uniref:Uncharacterized protein n=1 Tax=Ilyodon furcidens TaxID=33524 RepID=A0ABV0V103_9TELE